MRRLCQLIGIARSLFCTHLAGAEARAARFADDEALARRIRAVRDGDRAFGVPGITAELDDGAQSETRVNKKRVVRVMRETHIAGIRRRRGARTTVPDLDAQLKLEIGMRVFCAAPHSPWQRPANASTNGLPRQDFPMGTDLSRSTAEDLKMVVPTINYRLREVLGWRTPAEVLAEQLRPLAPRGPVPDR